MYIYIYKKKTSRITFEAQSRPVALRLRSLLLLLWKSVALYSVPVSLRLRSFATLTLERVIYLFFLHTQIQVLRKVVCINIGLFSLWYCLCSSATALIPAKLSIMTGPVDTGDLVRSLVRIPGSGHVRSAGTICLDLSRVSTLAALVPVPQTLPPALVSYKQPSPRNAADQTKLGSKTAAAIGALPRTLSVYTNRGRKRSCAEEASTGSARGSAALFQNPPLKRSRIVYMTAEQLARFSNVSTINTPSGPIFCIALRSASFTASRPLAAPSIISQDSQSHLFNEKK